MKFIKLTQAEADAIGFYRINDFLAIYAKAGKLKAGGYALPEAVIDDLIRYKETSVINKINLNNKNRITLTKAKFKTGKLL